MAGCKRIEIVLTNPQVLYFPGQTLQGQLQIDATSDIRTRAIVVQCYGEGHVQWEESTGDSSTTYESSDVYLDTQLTVYAKGGNFRTVLSEGNHVFPFEFVLPAGLPGSFEGMKNCYVRYWLTGLINGTWTSDDQWSGDRECKKRFNIGGVVDLNTTLGAKTPIELHDSQTVCCCCCESDPIKARLRLDKTGYAPGESVVCDGEITDGTGRGTNYTQIKLMQRVTYKTHKSSRKHREQQECARLQRGAIQPGGSDVFCGERLLIPPLPPSHLPGCRMIDIEYMVKMTVSMADSLSNLSLAADVIIGTIPIHPALQNRPPRSHIDACLGLDRPTVQTDPPVVQTAASGNYDLPPPSYQECLIRRTGEADNNKDTGTVASCYAYYDCINQPDSSFAPTDMQPQTTEQNRGDQKSAAAQL